MDILINIVGFIANILSLTETIPQAIKTWKNRNNPVILKGVSVASQIMIIARTTSWCLYGLLKQDYWLSFATIIVLPLALLNIYLIKRNGGN